MKIAVVNEDTCFGPADIVVGRYGAAQLAGEYLARGLHSLGNDVTRISGCPKEMVHKGVRYIPGHSPPSTEDYDAAIALRHVWAVKEINASVKAVWVQDQFGHEGVGFDLYPDTHIVVPSEFMRGIMEKYGKVKIIKLGAPKYLLNYYVSSSVSFDPFSCYTSGCWVECRGTLQAISIVEKAAVRSGRKMELSLFGDEALWGESKRSCYGKMVEALADSKGFTHIHGTLDHSSMMDALEHQEIFIHPTTAETCWVSGLEAAMAGRAMVYYPAGAAGEWGFAGACNGIEEMIDTLVGYALDYELYESHCKRNREIASLFTWEKVAGRWVEYLKSLRRTGP